MKEWLQVLKAADAAARWHVHQRRKGPAEEPYINHLVEVAMLVADATDGSDTNLVIAALLHDAIEDCEVPRELIAESFGEDVAAIVEEVTDDKSLPKAVRKEEQINASSAKSPRAKLLKLADKTSNLRAVAASAPAEWSVKRRIEYVRWARDVAKGLRGANQRLEDQFDESCRRRRAVIQTGYLIFRARAARRRRNQKISHQRAASPPHATWLAFKGRHRHAVGNALPLD
jgi:guanosine-3',5'-bis(diphosphate) 3'-pyrophosphohydrolase